MSLIINLHTDRYNGATGLKTTKANQLTFTTYCAEGHRDISFHAYDCDRESLLAIAAMFTRAAEAMPQDTVPQTEEDGA